jgi:hypothetical protein
MLIPHPFKYGVRQQVDKNTDGSMTYHFAVKTDQGETLTPGASKETSDFVTVYNFYGLVAGSAKSPAGWGVTTICSARAGSPAIANSEASNSASPKVFST